MQHKKVLLLILDGFGIGSQDDTNAIYLAKPKIINDLITTYPNLKIAASEESVALPSGQPGNSEVGHLTIGAGRIFMTGLTLISDAIKNKEFFKNKVLLEAINNAKKHGTNVHILGLTSDGDVHASLNHLFATIQLCNEHNVIPVIDLFSDGRDTQPKDFLETIKLIKKEYLDTNKARLGIIAGRYYAMDRNKSWDRTELTFKALTSESDDHMDPIKYIEQCYANNITDEFIKPKSFNTTSSYINDNDSLIFFNFRSDRIRQLIHIWTNNQNDYQYKSNLSFPVHITGLMDYKMEGMQNIAFVQPVNEIYLGKIIADNNLKQLRIAETEKYAHVTYFLDSMQTNKEQGCDCILIPSPSVATYDLMPEMSAKHVTDYIVNNYQKYDFIAANYANADMVGHTGNMKATIKAIKIIDDQVKKILETVGKNNEYVIIITADHGNADKMIDKNGIIVTKHTTNLVPLIVIDKNVELISNGGLVNIAPTILNYLGINIPTCMEKSLLK